MPKGRAMRRANGSGTVVKLSGRRRRPFEVRVNTKIDEWGYPRYDVLGRFADRTEALQVLARYNDNPFDVGKRDYTFSQVYDLWYAKKFTDSRRVYSDSTLRVSQAAYKRCAELHDRTFSELRTPDLQNVLNDFSLSWSYMRHIVNLYSQLYKYAMEYELVNRDYSRFVKIEKENDNQPGVPFTKEEIDLLWEHVNEESPCREMITVILVLIYTGWRIAEFLNMPISDIDLDEWTMKGGMKTAAGKGRIVPVHSGIRPLLKWLCSRTDSEYLLVTKNGRVRTRSVIGSSMRTAMFYCGIKTDHTPHDCRHTFISLLDSAGANPVCIDRLVGHASKSITSKIYTHKDLDELREAVEKIKI